MASEWKAGVHPTLAGKVSAALMQMAMQGHPMRVCQALRTTEQQAALYAQGRTVPGAIVTNCDGVVKKSNHQAHDDGFGHAVDCCFLNGEPFGETQPWGAYGEAIKAAGLVWGGDWVHLPDRPHAEMP